MHATSLCKNGSKIIVSRLKKNHRLEVCQSLKGRVQNDPDFIKMLQLVMEFESMVII